MKYDFCGYATKNDLKCADGRVIRRDAFKDNDGKEVPLVWNHLHSDPTNVIGHAMLENREDGVYAYGYLNDSEWGKHAKTLIQHGDITSMSIFANHLKQQGSNVIHGVIREVSLVLAGANPGAKIENISFAHSDGYEETLEDEARIYYYLDLEHDDLEEDSEEEDSEEETDEEETEEETEDDDISHADDSSDETLEDVYNSMNDKQKNLLYYCVGKAVEDEADDEEGTEETMKHNLFDASTDESEDTLSHDEIISCVEAAKTSVDGSMKAAFLAHGIQQIDYLFPEAKLVTPTPEMIARPNSWVSEVWNALKKSPFARIKSTAADVTADEARARGYIKGKQKKEEVVRLLKRVTTPKTVYKLQKMDRDDIIDITDIDIIAWLKAEMRMMLDEELSRAVLVGDGRSDDSDDKISTENIRPIYGDSEVYTIYKNVTLTGDRNDDCDLIIDAALEARKDYMGSGNPTFYASTDVINIMLLAKDKIGRRLYSNLSELADVLRVSKIVEVPVLEGQTRGEEDEKTTLQALIVNLSDYTIGADKGGAVNMFDDFDINFNKYEYLIETRVSGALTKPYSAIAIETAVEDETPDTPAKPSTPDTPIEG